MTEPLPEPAGFPRCLHCAFVTTGTARFCSTCAGRTLAPVAASHCRVCSQSLDPGQQQCVNRVCRLPLLERGFTRVDAVAMYTGPLKDKIHALKYDGKAGWAIIFGRLLVGWMQTHPEQMSGIDLVLGNPTHQGREPIQHIEAIMAAAYTEDPTHDLPLRDPDRPLLIKKNATPQSANRNLDDKRSAAIAHAAELIWVGIPDLIRGAHILLIDDVLTSGSQLQHVARRLIKSGAAEVRGLVLARVPWG